jgi:hypothetical protein
MNKIIIAGNEFVYFLRKYLIKRIIERKIILIPPYSYPNNASLGGMASSEGRVEIGAAGKLLIPLPRHATARLVRPGGCVRGIK